MDEWHIKLRELEITERELIIELGPISEEKTALTLLQMSAWKSHPWKINLTEPV